MGEERGAYRILVRRPGEGDHLGDPGVDGRIIIRRIFVKWDGWGGGMYWIELAEVRNR
jgi:hypothetical protein